MELNMSMKQTQTLSPQMMQSMEILQMGSQELLEYIENQVQENPVLEMEEKYAGKDEGVDLQRKLEWLESTDAQNRVYHQQDSEDDGTDPVSNYGNADETEENLYLYVLSQLELLDLEPELLEAGRFLVESLNQNGWLDEPLEDLAVQMEKPLDLAARALEIVQSLEPAGVGGPSRNVWCSSSTAARTADWQSGSPRTIWTPSARIDTASSPRPSGPRRNRSMRPVS